MGAQIIQTMDHLRFGRKMRYGFELNAFGWIGLGR